MVTTRSRPLFHIAGIPVRGDVTLLIIVGLLAVSAGNRVIANSELGSYAAFGVGVAAALLFLGGVLAHELGHAFAARRFGLRVDGISLWLFGGAAGIGEARTPRQEGVVAFAGPAVSLLLGGGFLATAALTRDVLPSVLTAELFLLGVLNLVLAVFNLLPGLPLDGGRIVRSVVWWRSGDPDRATVIAASAGAFISWALFGVGVWRLTAGDVLGGVWLIVLSFFLRTAGRAEATAARTKRQVSGVTAGQMVAPAALRMPYLATLEEVATALAARPDDDVVLLTEVDRVVGVLRVDQVAVARAERPWALAGAAMVGVDALGRLPADLPAYEALGQLAGDPWGMRLVVDGDGRPVGVLSLTRATGWLRRREELEFAGTTRR